MNIFQLISPEEEVTTYKVLAPALVLEIYSSLQHLVMNFNNTTNWNRRTIEEKDNRGNGKLQKKGDLYLEAQMWVTYFLPFWLPGKKNAFQVCVLGTGVFLFTLVYRWCPVKVGGLGKELPNLEMWDTELYF